MSILFNKIWNDIKLIDCQLEYWNCEDKLVSNYSDRCTGKSELGRRKLIALCLSGSKYNDYLFMLPIKNQAINNWKYLLSIIPTNAKRKIKINATRRYIQLSDNRIHIIGCEELDKYYGMELSGAILDESSNISCENVKYVSSMLIHRNGFLHRIGVLDKKGIGYNDYIKFINNKNVTNFSWKRESVVFT